MTLVQIIGAAIVGLFLGIAGTIFYIYFKQKKEIEKLTNDETLDMIELNKMEVKKVHGAREQKVREIKGREDESQGRVRTDQVRVDKVRHKKKAARPRRDEFSTSYSSKRDKFLLR